MTERPRPRPAPPTPTDLLPTPTAPRDWDSIMMRLLACAAILLMVAFAGLIVVGILDLLNLLPGPPR